MFYLLIFDTRVHVHLCHIKLINLTKLSFKWQSIKPKHNPDLQNILDGSHGHI